MTIPAKMVQQLREKTNAGMMDCKKALEEAGGDMGKALVLLRRKGAEIATKKASRDLKAGVIASYIHSDNRIGAMVELLCETDFVARNKEFQDLANELAMHITAMAPRYLKRADVVEDDLKKAEEALKEETDKLDKPKDIKEKILQGKLDSYFKEETLLTQAYIKDQEITVEILIERMTQKIGERIEISRFTRYELLKE